MAKDLAKDLAMGFMGASNPVWCGTISAIPFGILPRRIKALARRNTVLAENCHHVAVFIE
ncbi:MAG: hypothetical protein CSA74_10350 [Rhodobacterales bacterium]|nr:MAG: hypothetical protein CSA74_10350 [Rhodobacterales bacterium]